MEISGDTNGLEHSDNGTGGATTEGAFEYQAGDKGTKATMQEVKIPFSEGLTAGQQLRQDALRVQQPTKRLADSVGPPNTPAEPKPEKDWKRRRRTARCPPAPPAPNGDFMAAPAYYGAVKGYVFKTSDGATGYYRRSGWQARNSSSPAAASAAAPRGNTIQLFDALGIGLVSIPISLWAELIDDDDHAAVVSRTGVTVELPTENLGALYTGAAKARRMRRQEPRGVKRARKRRELEAATLNDSGVERSADPLLSLVNGQALSDTLYTSVACIEGGDIWSFDQINSTDWGPAVSYLCVSTADAAMFQELKRPEGDAVKEAEDEARKLGWDMTITPCVKTFAKGRSAGVGIAARAHHGLAEPKIKPSSAGLASRITMAWFPGLLRGGVHLVSIYLYTGEGPYSDKNRPIMELASRMLDALDGPFIIGADWQVPPETLIATQWPLMVRGVVRAPSVPTCGDAILDYFVVSEGLDDSVELIRAGAALGLQDNDVALAPTHQPS